MGSTAVPAGHSTGLIFTFFSIICADDRLLQLNHCMQDCRACDAVTAETNTLKCKGKPELSKTTKTWKNKANRVGILVAIMAWPIFELL